MDLSSKKILFVSLLVFHSNTRANISSCNVIGSSRKGENRKGLWRDMVGRGLTLQAGLAFPQPIPARHDWHSCKGNSSATVAEMAIFEKKNEWPKNLKSYFIREMMGM
jgi:hypothetical protein